MPRPLRPIAEGLVYHVINRGNNRQPVFLEEGDYEAFLQAIGDRKRRKPFDLFGYCLMPDHFHLLVRPQEGTISRLVQSLLVSHARRFHRACGAGGRVWQGRFKSPVVQDDDHLLRVLRYIEATPVRAGIASRAEEYHFSSYGAHALGRRDDLLDRLLPYEALATTPPARQRRWELLVQEGPEESELARIRRSVQTGLPYGEPQWISRLSARLGLQLTIRPRGRPRKTSP